MSLTKSEIPCPFCHSSADWENQGGWYRCPSCLNVIDAEAIRASRKAAKDEARATAKVTKSKAEAPPEPPKPAKTEAEPPPEPAKKETRSAREAAPSTGGRSVRSK